MTTIWALRPLRLARIVALGCVWLAAAAGSANAQTDNGGGIGGAIVGGLFQALQNAVVAGAWQRVDQPTKDCLANQYNATQDTLIQQGILPADSRVAPYIQQCQQAMAAQQQQQEQQAQEQQQQATLEPQQNTAANPKAQRADLTKKYGHKAAKLILAGQIAKGMTQEEVSAAWGEPSQKDTTTPGQETWNYGNDNVTFRSGKVADVTH